MHNNVFNGRESITMRLEHDRNMKIHRKTLQKLTPLTHRPEIMETKQAFEILKVVNPFLKPYTEHSNDMYMTLRD